MRRERSNKEGGKEGSEDEPSPRETGVTTRQGTAIEDAKYREEDD